MVVNEYFLVALFVLLWAPLAFRVLKAQINIESYQRLFALKMPVPIIISRFVFSLITRIATAFIISNVFFNLGHVLESE